MDGRQWHVKKEQNKWTLPLIYCVLGMALLAGLAFLAGTVGK
jgi:hypothetical protein